MKQIGMVAALMILVGSTAQAGVAEGKQLFMAHCATCHGVTAKGDGPMAGAMVMKPADLSVLRAGNEGVLPIDRIIRRIDGRDPLISHGSPMPVYGDFFQGRDVGIPGPFGQLIMTSQPIVDLIDFLDTVQTP